MIQLINPTEVEETYMKSVELWLSQHELNIVDMQNELAFNKKRIKHLQELSSLIEQDLIYKNINKEAVIENVNYWATNCNKEKEIKMPKFPDDIIERGEG